MTLTKESLIKLLSFCESWNNNSVYKSCSDKICQNNIAYLEKTTNKDLMFFMKCFYNMKFYSADMEKSYNSLLGDNYKLYTKFDEIIMNLQTFLYCVIARFDVDKLEILMDNNYENRTINAKLQKNFYSFANLEKEKERISIKENQLIPFIKRDTSLSTNIDTLQLFLPIQFLYWFNILFSFREFNTDLSDLTILNNRKKIKKYIETKRAEIKLFQEKHDFHKERIEITDKINSLFDLYKQLVLSDTSITLIAEAELFSYYQDNFKKKDRYYYFKDSTHFSKFRHNLNHFMELRNLNNQSLERFSGVSRKKIHDYLKKDDYLQSEQPIKIYRDTINKLASALNITFDFLVSDTSHPIEFIGSNSHVMIAPVTRISPYKTNLDLYNGGRDLCKSTLNLITKKENFLTDEDFKKLQKYINELANNFELKNLDNEKS
ncbi:helix-turn-helix domain-containing protein [Anaerosinus sp.]